MRSTSGFAFFARLSGNDGLDGEGPGDASGVRAVAVFNIHISWWVADEDRPGVRESNEVEASIGGSIGGSCGACSNSSFGGGGGGSYSVVGGGAGSLEAIIASDGQPEVVEAEG